MTSIFSYPHIGLFVVSWLLADLLIPVLINISPMIGAMDHPHSYKSHKKPVSFLGGIGIFLAFSISIFLIIQFEGYAQNKPLFAITLASSFLVIVGAIDDFRSISALLKLLILAGVTILLIMSGIKLDMFSDRFWYANGLLTLLWLAGVSSSMNSLDNTDGVAAGIAGIISIFAFFIAWKSFLYHDNGYWRRLQRWTSFAGITLFGSVLGFLRYNFYKPRIFLGDNGSLFLGFIVGAFALLGGWSQGDPLRSLIVPCSLLAVPLYDITLSTILRWQEGKVNNLIEAVFYCGQDHITHRLMALGFTKYETIIFIYLLGFCSCSIALLVSHPAVSRTQYLLITAFSLLLLSFFGQMLSKAPLQSE